MRAAVYERYGSARQVEVREIPIPRPGDGQVLVRVDWSSINTADLDLLRGKPPVTRLAYGLRRPRNGRLGADMVGQIAETGGGVEGVQTGDHVWADLFEAGHASFAEYVCVRASALRHSSPQLDPAIAATLPHSGLLALQALRKGNIAAGDSVLVNGAGGCVGPFAIQIAKARGAVVTGVDRGDKLEFMAEVGADRVLDYTVTDITRVDQRFDTILDIAATRSPLAFRRVLADGGRYVHLARSLAGYFHAAGSGVLTNRLSRSRISNFAWKANASDDLAEIGRLVEAGEVAPVVDQVCELADVPAALARHAAGDARGKILIRVDRK